MSDRTRWHRPKQGRCLYKPVCGSCNFNSYYSRAAPSFPYPLTDTSSTDMSWSEDHQQRHTIAPRLVFSCFFKFGYSFWSFWQQGKHPQPWQVVDRGAFGRLGGWFESSSDVAGKWVRIPRWENTCRDKITKAKSVGINLRILPAYRHLPAKVHIGCVFQAAPALQIFLDVPSNHFVKKKIWAKRSENTEESPLGGPTWGGFLTLMLVPFFTTNSMLQLEGGSWYFSNYISLMDEFQRCHLDLISQFCKNFSNAIWPSISNWWHAIAIVTVVLVTAVV